MRIDSIWIWWSLSIVLEESGTSRSWSHFGGPISFPPFHASLTVRNCRSKSMCRHRSARSSPRRNLVTAAEVKTGVIQNVPPGTVAVIGEQRPELLRREDPPLLLLIFHPPDTSGRIPVDLFPVKCLPEDHLHYTECLVHRSWYVLCSTVGNADLTRQLGWSRIVVYLQTNQLEHAFSSARAGSWRDALILIKAPPKKGGKI